MHHQVPKKASASAHISPFFKDTRFKCCRGDSAKPLTLRLAALPLSLRGSDMANQSESNSAIPLRQENAASMDGGKLDTADHLIVKLLQKAVGAAESNSRQALEGAENELQVAQTRIAELEALVQHYREKSERAEDWLNEILTEIEDRLIRAPEEKRRQMSRCATLSFDQ
jgi:cell fate (sporulation/competence/biofilm development) regulator YmcA (YheA/YmcA/DUF963 family)